MIKQHHRQSGFAHVGTMVFGAFALFVIVFAGVQVSKQKETSLDTASAAAVHVPTGKVSGKHLSDVKRAAYLYWSNNPVASERYKKATCKVTNVRLRYYPDTKINAYASAYLGGAYRYNPYDLNHKTPKAAYCIINWYLSETKTQTLKDNCETFIHEYGHLLGYEHNADPRNIMYAGYARDGISGELGNELFKSNVNYADKSTICPSIPYADRKL